MGHRNTTALEYAKDITIAYINAASLPTSVVDSENNIAGFVEVVFDKLVELEDKASVGSHSNRADT